MWCVCKEINSAPVWMLFISYQPLCSQTVIQDGLLQKTCNGQLYHTLVYGITNFFSRKFAAGFLDKLVTAVSPAPHCTTVQVSDLSADRQAQLKPGSVQKPV